MCNMGNDFYTPGAVKSSRFPHSRRNAPCDGIECAPTSLRVCDASGGKPEWNSSREGVPHEVLTKCGRGT